MKTSNPAWTWRTRRSSCCSFIHPNASGLDRGVHLQQWSLVRPFSTQPKQKERWRKSGALSQILASWHRLEMMEELQKVKLWAVLTRRERKVSEGAAPVKTRDERREAVTERCPSEDTRSMFGCWALAVLFGRCVPACENTHTHTHIYTAKHSLWKLHPQRDWQNQSTSKSHGRHELRSTNKTHS